MSQNVVVALGSAVILLGLLLLQWLPEIRKWLFQAKADLESLAERERLLEEAED